MVITPLSQNIILTAQSKHSSQKIPLQSFFNTLFLISQDGRSPIQSYFSGVQNPNMFLWLLGDLPGGRQPSQEKGHLGCCKRHRKTHQMNGNRKGTCDLWREQKALKTGRKPQVSLAICHFLKSTQPKIFLKRNKVRI